MYGTNIAVYNNADLHNSITQNNTTGDNTADRNNGDVAIKTGDIVVALSILNENINGSIVSVSCCQEKAPEQPGAPKPPVVPPSPPIGGGNGCQNNCGGTSGGHTLGASTGPSLPVTGAPWTFILTILALGMFISGLFLRYQTGSSPPALA
jgi:hypothetical protein